MIVSMAYPTVYIQEPNILREAGDWLGKYGSRLFVVSGHRAWRKAGASVEQSLKAAGLFFKVCRFQGSCTYAEAERIRALIPKGTDLIVAVGGGQCMDTAKLVAARAGLPVATIPTLASTCASTTPLSIMYDGEHRYVGVEYYDRCPVLTLVDTGVIAEAPYRYLIAGIGDALAKWYEAYPINEGKSLDARTRLGLKIAELARDLLLEHGEQAISENKQGKAGLAIRQIIDVNIYYAGLVGGIGHYTCRGSAAHSFHNGMVGIIQGIDQMYHGEIVAFGILCQLVLEGKPLEEIVELIKFYLSIRLPVSFYDLHVKELKEDELRASARSICHPSQNIHLLPFSVTEEMVYQAMMDAHRLGEQVKAERTLKPLYWNDGPIGASG
mgnify:FL=1